MLKGLLPRYDSQGNLSATGRTYLWPNEPNFKASKKADVVVELRKFPKVQEELLEMLKKGLDDPTAVNESQDLDGDLSDEDFERIALEDAEAIKNGKLNEAEEESGSWDDI